MVLQRQASTGAHRERQRHTLLLPRTGANRSHYRRAKLVEHGVELELGQRSLLR
jgi:hypothetical protein